MWFARRNALLLLLASASLVAAKSCLGDRLLIVLDAGTEEANYSVLFESLQERGFELFIRDTKSDIKLFDLEQRAYDHAILFPQKSKGLGPDLNPQALLAFINAGGNLLLGGSSSVPEAFRALAKEMDVELAERNSLVVDHCCYDVSSDERHSTILTGKFSNNEHIISAKVRDGAPILYKGIAHSMGNSPLIHPILAASRTSYSYDTSEEFEAVEDPWIAGPQTWLVSAVQARNNARVGISGSVEMFSNNFMAATIGKPGSIPTGSGNRAFVQELTEWIFHEKGVIRASKIDHCLRNEPNNGSLPSTYRVGNEVEISVRLQQYENNRWQAYDASDVQLELIMLDPYIRTTLSQKIAHEDYMTYSTSITLPDHYGVFHFKVNYKRPGLSYVEERSQVTIRHFRHNEYQRFLSAAYPYYSASLVTILGFLVFSVIWLFSRELSVAKKIQ